jgi:hypothetical protein
VIGLLLLAWPGAMNLFGAQPCEAGEEGLLRDPVLAVGAYVVWRRRGRPLVAVRV